MIIPRDPSSHRFALRPAPLKKLQRGSHEISHSPGAIVPGLLLEIQPRDKALL